MKHFTQQFLLIVTLLTTGLTSYCQELKKYSGRFTINNVEGVAEYTYRDAEDGTRIFEGDFSFSGKDNYDQAVKYSVEGKFHNNYQVGKWTWKGPWNLWYGYEDNNPSQIITFTFNDAGQLDGEASFYGDPNDHYTIVIHNDEIVGNVPFVYDGLKATWKNGHLVGKYEFVLRPNSRLFYSDFTKVSGQFNDDGKPIGLWTAVDSDGEVIRAKFSESGQEEYCYRIDETTGDKVGAYFPIGKVSFYLGLFEGRGRFLLRDSKLKNGYDYEEY